MPTVALVVLLALAVLAPTAHAASSRRFEAGTCSATELADGRLDAGARRAVAYEDESASASSQERRISITPALVELVEVGSEQRALRPGDSITCVVTIRNRRGETTTFDLETRGLLGTRDGIGLRSVAPGDDDAAATAVAWIEPATNRVRLRPLQLARVPVVVTIPADPPVGSAYASLDVVPDLGIATPGPGGADLGIEAAASLAFLLRVGGDGEPELQLRDVSAPRLRSNRDAWTLRADLDNDGTLHATPTGRVRIRSLFGSVVTELPISERQLLPGSRVRIDPSWKRVPWFGIYRYDVRVASSDGSDAPARATGWFVALPPTWVLAIVAALLAASIAGLVTRRRRDRGDDDVVDDGTDDAWD